MNQKCNNDNCRCECKNPTEHHACKKDNTWNPCTCTCENGEHLASIIKDSMITCDEIIEPTKTVPAKSTSRKTVPTKGTPTNFNKKRYPMQRKSSMFYLPFYELP